VLDEVAAPLREKGHSPSFRPMSIVDLWPNGWIDEDATWYGSRPRPRPHCVKRGPSSPTRERGTAAPLFSAHFYCGHGRPSQLLLSCCPWMSTDGQGTKCRRKIAENHNRLSMCTSVTDDRQTDRRTRDSIANVNVSSRFDNYWLIAWLFNLFVHV